MTTQREQLELAAKACGIPDAGMYYDTPSKKLYVYGSVWNPIDDSGDCAKMRARLKLNISWGIGCVAARQYDEQVNHVEYYENDPEAAERAACVAVAAEIGRRMKA